MSMFFVESRFVRCFLLRVQGNDEEVDDLLESFDFGSLVFAINLQALSSAGDRLQRQVLG